MISTYDRLSNFYANIYKYEMMAAEEIKCSHNLLELSRQILTRHVTEAFRLMNKSIIRVEQPDVNLGSDNEDEVEEETEQPAAQDTERGDTPMEQDGEREGKQNEGGF